MRKNKIWMIVLSATILLASCSMARNMASGATAQESPAMESMPAAAPSEDIAKMGFEESMDAVEYDTAAAESASSERIVIKNANLSIVVVDPVASMDAIDKMAVEMGGFVVNSNTYKTTTYSGREVPTATITIRVPAENLDEAMSRIKGMVEDPEIDIISEDVSGQDVTGEVNDLESKLRNSQAAEAQLLELMDKAASTEDVVEIFRELKSVREEIEVTQGQIKYYRESASLSAISVYLQAKEAVEPITVAGWKPGLQAQKALQALVKGGQYLVDMLIWLIIFAIPFLAVIFLPIYFIVKAIHKRRQKNAAAQPKKEK
ncbi:MAG: DUF4349 domain-containing protein [Anaerolineae bacterium]|nr:DUF4349 domain-containing protein [Anaerolineae bacterium]